MLAIIGGSGASQLPNLEVLRREVARTPYGEPSGSLCFGRICGEEVVFLPRHGYGHTIAPHEINYRANIWALAQQKPRGVIAVASVGGIPQELGPGVLVVPDQIIDYTWGRKSTFHDGPDARVTHVDFTEPYDAGLRGALLAAAARAGIAVRDGGTYAATQGPRLETAAEINRYERDGAHIVGMTGMPEAVLAREAGLAYAALAVVANHAAGRGDSARGIRFEGMQEVLETAMGQAHRLIEEVLLDKNCAKPAQA